MPADPSGRPSPLPPEVSILMVCLGNICRSPTAEGVMRRRLAEAGLGQRVLVDSAGTYAGHRGAPPDLRSQRHALRRGFDLSGLRARVVVERDFERFDLILAMDWENLASLQDDCPPVHAHKLRRLMEFAPAGLGEVVPDPYAGGAAGFEDVLDRIEAACNGLLTELRQRLETRS